MSLVIFDLDNTVVHSTIDFAGIRRGLIALLRKHRVTDATDAELVRRSIGQIIELGEAHDSLVGTRLVREAWQIVLEYESAGMRAATVEADAAESLDRLRQYGYRLAVLTNNARAATLEALDKFALRSAFDVVITRDEAAMKPEPAGIVLARAMLAADGRAAMVGDSWLDGTAAARAGIPFIAFRPRPGALEERAIPVWSVVDRLAAIPDVLEGAWPEVPTADDGDVR